MTEPAADTCQSPRSLEQLRDDHASEKQLFQRFLEALIDRRMTEALTALDAFAENVAEHITAEDDFWIPQFDRRFGMTRGFGATLLLSEHRLIEKLLRELHQQARAICTSESPAPAVDILLLIEAALRFRGVVDHHQEREERVMIPALAEPA
ncbi:MAG: hemerythrin domain-containing protein [Phycisphaerae bacterium]|nr:hemerythrin domain-containing protein [Phycisphaerae bacterium]NUQ44602.1 hemerythrin domain-containing protein [Phycisphaerae bacterium]